MNMFFQIEYTNKEGDSVHSDFCIKEEDVRGIIKQLVNEIDERADFNKPFALTYSGPCTEHNN